MHVQNGVAFVYSLNSPVSMRIEAIITFMRELKVYGMPFDFDRSAAYSSLEAAQFRDLVLGEPRHQTKRSPLLQIADLYLFPMAKAGYDSS